MVITGDGCPTRSDPLLGSAITKLPRNEMFKRGVMSLAQPDRLKRYQQVFSLTSAEIVDGLFHAGALPLDPGDRILGCWSDLLPAMQHTDELGGLQFRELRSSLPDDLLMYADELSMAHAIEVRVPYLDREIVEYVQRLGGGFKVRRGIRKCLNRRVARTYLPAPILKRKKRGFAANVVDGWFQSSVTGKMD